MSILTLSLIAHVVIGLVGVIASYATLMSLLKRAPKLKFLKYASLTAFVSYFISWLTAGYYYVVFYGSSVKPIIKAGSYPWAHSLITETKEHVFLFLPIISFLTFLVILFTGDVLEENAKLKKTLAFIVGATVVVGIFITLSGIIISGAVR